MTEREEGTQHEDPSDHESAAESSPADYADPGHRTAPPGNPDADQDAVEKGEENIGRVTGR